MSQNTVWKYNDNEFVIDLADADTFERYWDACEKLGQREDELKNSESDRGFMRRYCDMFYGFFDDAIGEGAAEKMFQGRHNTQVCEDAYDSFISFAGQQVKETNATRLNRAQRRNQSKRSGQGYMPRRNNYEGRWQ